VENWLCLPSISRLLAVITALPLGREAVLPLLVLGNLVKGVLPAFLVLAVGLLGLWDVHLPKCICIIKATKVNMYVRRIII
jgi:hypothetical protein